MEFCGCQCLFWIKGIIWDFKVGINGYSPNIRHSNGDQLCSVEEKYKSYTILLQIRPLYNLTKRAKGENKP